ncbi:MAG TPA: hypothetical protein VGI23_02595 [Steroidobacteraceae bacterium]|jgi:hypothetical protein
MHDRIRHSSDISEFPARLLAALFILLGVAGCAQVATTQGQATSPPYSPYEMHDRGGDGGGGGAGM